eukprot:3990995-Amphidinium_carterae.1
MHLSKIARLVACILLEHVSYFRFGFSGKIGSFCLHRPCFAGFRCCISVVCACNETFAQISSVTPEADSSSRHHHTRELQQLLTLAMQTLAQGRKYCVPIPFKTQPKF